MSFPRSFNRKVPYTPIFVLLLQIIGLLQPTLAQQNETYVAANGPGGETIYLPDNRKPALYTQNFGDCLGDSLLNVTRYNAAYYADNMTVTFTLEGSVAVSGLSLLSQCQISILCSSCVLTI